jgi:hypothetical protein
MTFEQLYGADAFDDPNNWTADGRFRPKRKRAAGIASDGGSTRVPMMFADAGRAAQMLRDGAYGASAGFVRGFQFGGPIVVDDAATIAARDAAATAYEARKQRLTNAWRDRKQHQNQQPPAAAAPPAPLALAASPRSLTDARALAAAAYEAKCERLRNAWRK